MRRALAFDEEKRTMCVGDLPKGRKHGKRKTEMTTISLPKLQITATCTVEDTILISAYTRGMSPFMALDALRIRGSQITYSTICEAYRKLDEELDAQRNGYWN